MNLLPAFDQHFFRPVQRAFQFVPRALAARQQLDHGLEAQHQTLETLKQRIVQFSCDALALRQLRLHPVARALGDHPEPPSIHEPGRTAQKGEAQEKGAHLASQTKSAWSAPLVKILVPFTTKWSPSRTARVASEARSVPAPGSL